MKFLALDLGTATGYCYSHDDKRISGAWKLATIQELKVQKKERYDRRGDVRVYRFFEKIKSLQTQVGFDVVIFEDVQFSTFTNQTQLWASFRTALWMAFPPGSRPIVECINVKSLKSLSTGNGNADKNDMARALAAAEPDKFKTYSRKNSVGLVEKGTGRLLTDDEVDAIHIWRWAQVALGRMPT
jgi:Holliday junction resolvasome RuvABC endonuclease subunit